MHGLKPLLFRFQLLLLVRLLFQAVCPGKGVSEEAITQNHKPGQTQVFPVFCCLSINSARAGGELPALTFCGKGLAMIIVMKAGAAKKDKDEVLRRIKELGYTSHVIHGTTRDVIGAIGDERGKAALQALESLNGVENVVPILQPYKLASLEVKKESSVVRISDEVVIGGSQIVIMAGPCSVESEEQIIESAVAVKKSGAHVLRGGAFKPRTSPYSF